MNVETKFEENAQEIKVTTGPLPASTKIYVEGTDPSIQVPMREIALEPSADEPDLKVYDTSGPYTDDNVEIDIFKGLNRDRQSWVTDRGDVEE
jgi:phosphomethylpyrimidine synthase